MACDARARQALSSAEQARWRDEARSWWTRSLPIYRSLEQAGALTGEDAAAPTELDQLVAGRNP